jgi:hypothetical protein
MLAAEDFVTRLSDQFATLIVEPLTFVVRDSSGFLRSKGLLRKVAGLGNRITWKLFPKPSVCRIGA